MPARHIADVRRDDRSIYRILLVDRSGSTRVAVRIWDQQAGPAKALGPTRDGLEFPPELTDQIVAALQAARAQSRDGD